MWSCTSNNHYQVVAKVIVARSIARASCQKRQLLKFANSFTTISAPAYSLKTRVFVTNVMRWSKRVRTSFSNAPKLLLLSCVDVRAVAFTYRVPASGVRNLYLFLSTCYLRSLTLDVIVDTFGAVARVEATDQSREWRRRAQSQVRSNWMSIKIRPAFGTQSVPRNSQMHLTGRSYHSFRFVRRATAFWFDNLFILSVISLTSGFFFSILATPFVFPRTGLP